MNPTLLLLIIFVQILFDVGVIVMWYLQIKTNEDVVNLFKLLKDYLTERDKKR